MVALGFEGHAAGRVIILRNVWGSAKLLSESLAQNLYDGINKMNCNKTLVKVQGARRARPV